MDKAVRHVVEQADGRRHRHRQRRRAAPDRFPDLRAAAHVRLRRRVEAPARPRVRGIPRAARLPDAALPAIRPRASRARRKRRPTSSISTSKPITDETARFNKIADELGAFSERFMTAASPGIISTTMLNAHYESHDAYLDAIAREMSKEYQAIHKAGLILQIDAPDLAMDRTMMYRDLRDGDFVKRCERHVAAINKGIEGIPRDRVRLHVCYGNWEGPHIHDIAAGEDPAGALHGQCRRAVDRVLQSAPRPRIRRAEEASAAARTCCSFPAWSRPPRISSSIRRWWRGASRRRWRAVGDRERVIASTDCGFGTFTKREWVIEPVVWLKLKAIREGADIASRGCGGRRWRNRTFRRRQAYNNGQPAGPKAALPNEYEGGRHGRENARAGQDHRRGHQPALQLGPPSAGARHHGRRFRGARRLPAPAPLPARAARRRRWRNPISARCCCSTTTTSATSPRPRSANGRATSCRAGRC